MSRALSYKTTNQVPVGFYFAIFILFITSMGCWIGWMGRAKYIYIAALILLLISLYNYYFIKFDLSKKNVILTFILCASSVIFDELKIEKIGSFIVYFVICCLHEKYQKQCLNYIFRWFAWMMIPSIIVYSFVQMGIMPSFGNINVYDNDTYGFYQAGYITRKQYYIYCYSSFYNIRFNVPFIEPGHLGMMSAFLIYADGFQFNKKETYILLLTIILSMSLAGYVLCFASYLFLKFEKKELKFRFIVLFFLGTLTLYLFGTLYNEGDNLLNELIISRLEYDEDKGFTGNNRVFGKIDMYFAAMFNDTNIMLFGYKKEILEYLAWNHSRGTGLMRCMVAHGFIGTIVGIKFCIASYLYAENKKTALMFLIFVFMLYWQRTYPFWFSWLICFVFGIANRSNVLYENRNINIPS